jgi:hypothetical protein
MAGIDDKREQEHKQRVKKLKAKTSKMRLAVFEGTGKHRKELSKDQSDLVYEYEVATPKQKKELDKQLKKINFKAKPRLAVIKKKKKDDEGDIDSDREMQRERDMERLQASAETGGDY